MEAIPLKKTLITTLALFLVSTICVLPLMGKVHKFSLMSEATLCGVALEPGDYKLKVSEDVAGIYRGRDLLVAAKVRIEPIAGAVANSCCCSDGILTEVRLGEEKVVFLEQVPLVPATN
jgi:hypothetical protein